MVVELVLEKITNSNQIALKRGWSNYSSFLLNSVLLPMLDAKLGLFINCSVQSYWNLLEQVIVTCADIVAPIINVVKSSPSKKLRNFIPPT